MRSQTPGATPGPVKAPTPRFCEYCGLTRVVDGVCTKCGERELTFEEKRAERERLDRIPAVSWTRPRRGLAGVR